jgi:primosomal protein N' (replication factor Y) (superfamily II helicase)
LRFISVAVPVPFLDLLTYNVPPQFQMPAIGARVRVPVGTRTVTGCVVDSPANGDLTHSTGGARLQPDLKDIVEVLDHEAFLPQPIVELCQWVAEYYVSGIGDAVAVALPPGAKHTASGFRTRRTAMLTAHGRAAAAAVADQTRSAPRTDSDADLRLSAKQRDALTALAGASAPVPLSDLRDRGVTADVIGRLAARGLVSLLDEAHERNPFDVAVIRDVTRDPSRQLTGEQAAALQQLEALADLREFRVALLHGVTGSGKSEIYLRLAQRVIGPASAFAQSATADKKAGHYEGGPPEGGHDGGRQVLMLVPEIALTPSVAALFRSAFADRVAIQHSALSDGERHDQWHRIRRGDVDLVIGTRSAVFAPLDRLGLIIVDEEHDASYKQEETPRYHGRDVAIMRASRQGALVVLGSATPSMESYQNAVAGKYTRVVLERRVLDRPLAAVRVVNMRDEYAAEGPDVVISRDLAASIEDRLSRREQVVILLNRRGYSTAVICRQCGDTFDCPNCSISLTVHANHSLARQSRDLSSGARSAKEEAATAAWRARCHYCNYSVMVPTACRKCAAPYLEHTGFGTEKVEQHLRERFPDARVGRVDRDSVRRKGALASLLSQFAAAELDVLVGTQMIAKGHDFPGVTLVGVISADVGLGLADFRAAERTFQLLTQVAGRAGRGERPGEAVIQTLYPEHYSVLLACRQDYPGFFEKEISFRRGMRYPPLVAMVNSVVRGRSFAEAMQTAAELVRRLEARGSGSLVILGPAPAPLARLRGEHRVQFFLKGTRRAEMRQALRAVLAEMPEIRRRVTVDVDPLSVL